VRPASTWRPACPTCVPSHRAWLAALRATLDTTPNRELAYPEPGGHPRLRQTLSEYLQRVRGAAVRADNVTVTTGVTDGMTQVFRALGAAGVGAVAVEDPGWYRRPVATVQGMDPARVALFGSLSKTLAPALSLGWVVTPPRWTQALRAAERRLTGPPVLDQLALAALIESGGYDRHLRSVRQRYRARWDRLVDALGRAIRTH
jgi:DNA-binding transcriptional MocR family regulator